MTSTKTFMGLPVKGDISEAVEEYEIPQRSEEEFFALLQELFAAGVKGVAWTQYTPAFNDGDPCVFTIGFDSGYLLTDEDVQMYRDGEMDPCEGASAYTIERDPAYGKDSPLYAAMKRFEGTYVSTYRQPGPDVVWGINSNCFDRILKKHFGNGSKVLATPEGFEVDYYECGY